MTRKKDIASSPPALSADTEPKPPQKTKNPDRPPTFSSAENGAAKMIVEMIIDGARKDLETVKIPDEMIIVKATKTVGDGPPEPLDKDDALRMLADMRADDDLERIEEADQAGPLTFTRYRHGGILPQIKHAGIRGYSVGSLADIFRESGYFGELTPAQIAVHILAGQELGFGPVKSMFDLKITPGEIFFSSIGSFDSVETDTQITKSKIEEAADLANKRDLSPFPQKDDLTPAPDSETISAAAQLASAGPIPVEPLREREVRRESPFPVSPALTPDPPPDDHADLADALAEFAVTNDPAAIVDDISFGAAAADFTPPSPAAVTTPPATIAEPAAVAAIPYNPADAGAFGDDTPAAVMDWQQNIERYCKELGIDAAEKVSKFRQIPTVAEKQKYHALVLRYYNEQTNVVRLEVMAILKEKNLSEPWEYTPIFDGLHVPFEHEKWTYGQAATVKAYLEESPQIPA